MSDSSVTLEELTLSQLKDFCRDLLRGGGGECPVCTQNMKVYKRIIHSTMAKDLIDFFRFAAGGWGYLPDAGIHRGGDLLKCRYWGLLESEEGQRDDGSKRTGVWRLTPKGRAWVLGEASVPKHAHVYNGRCFHISGPETTIHDALGNKFDYRELMSS